MLNSELQTLPYIHVMFFLPLSLSTCLLTKSMWSIAASEVNSQGGFPPPPQNTAKQLANRAVAYKLCIEWGHLCSSMLTLCRGACHVP